MIKFVLTHGFTNKILELFVAKYLKKKLGSDAMVNLRCMQIEESRRWDDNNRLKMKLELDVEMSTNNAVELISELLGFKKANDWDERRGF